jgi:hypothetical protein
MKKLMWVALAPFVALLLVLAFIVVACLLSFIPLLMAYISWILFENETVSVLTYLFGFFSSVVVLICKDSNA